MPIVQPVSQILVGQPLQCTFRALVFFSATFEGSRQHRLSFERTCNDRDKKLAEDSCEGRLRLLLHTIILALQAASMASLSLEFYRLVNVARP